MNRRKFLSGLSFGLCAHEVFAFDEIYRDRPNVARVSVSDFGVIGSDDDSATFQKAFDYWTSYEGPCFFLIPPGVYRFKKLLVADFSKESFYPKVLSGVGAVFEINLEKRSEGLVFSAGDCYVKNVFIRDLTIRIINDFCSDALVIKAGGLNKSWFYGLAVENITIYIAETGNGLVVKDNVFESRFVGINVRGFRNKTGYPILIFAERQGVPSSLRFDNCNTDGGEIGFLVKSPVFDVSLTGGTHIRARTWGVKIESYHGGAITNLHLENNWDNTSGESGAGMYIAGRAVISGCYGVANRFANQKYVVEGFVSQSMTIFGGAALGVIKIYAKLDGKVDSVVIVDDFKILDLSNNVGLVRLADFKKGER